MKEIFGGIGGVMGGIFVLFLVVSLVMAVGGWSWSDLTRGLGG